MYLLTYHQQTNYSEQTNEQTKVIEEVVSPEVSKLNHVVKQRDQMQFSLEKRIEKRNLILPTHHRWLPVDGLCYKMGYSIYLFY